MAHRLVPDRRLLRLVVRRPAGVDLVRDHRGPDHAVPVHRRPLLPARHPAGRGRAAGHAVLGRRPARSDAGGARRLPRGLLPVVRELGHRAGSHPGVGLGWMVRTRHRPGLSGRRRDRADHGADRLWAQRSGRTGGRRAGRRGLRLLRPGRQPVRLHHPPLGHRLEPVQRRLGGGLPVDRPGGAARHPPSGGPGQRAGPTPPPLGGPLSTLPAPVRPGGGGPGPVRGGGPGQRSHRGGNRRVLHRHRADRGPAGPPGRGDHRERTAHPLAGRLQPAAPVPAAPRRPDWPAQPPAHARPPARRPHPHGAQPLAGRGHVRRPRPVQAGERHLRSRRRRRGAHRRRAPAGHLGPGGRHGGPIRRRRVRRALRGRAEPRPRPSTWRIACSRP